MMCLPAGSRIYEYAGIFKDHQPGHGTAEGNGPAVLCVLYEADGEPGSPGQVGKYPAQVDLNTACWSRGSWQIGRKKKGYGKMVSGPLRKNRAGRWNRCHELSPGYAGNDGCHADVSRASLRLSWLYLAPPYYPAFHSDRLGRQIGRDGLEVYRKEVYRQERVPSL